MELKVSSLKPGGLSPSNCSSDPEEKEVSDEDDDDRNHKHRRRETHPQSSERDSLEPVFTRSYRKRNRPFENGHPFKDESQGSEPWKNYNISPQDKDLTSKFDKRRPGMGSMSRINMDLNQRFRSNRSFSREPGPVRGRGSDIGSWNQSDTRFSSVDIASQMVLQSSITPSFFVGRGRPNVSNVQNVSWNAFGLIPGIPSGGLEGLHSISLQGTLRPTVNSSLDRGMPRQRCRDFEERGFCLRGDMCPMEHGVNRIVVEDVKSLSQFNLPVSLPSASLVGTPAGPGALPSVGAPSTTLMNSKGLHSRSSKPGGMVDDDMCFNGACSSSATVSGADLYDPDQPLWNNNGPETSSAPLAICSSKNDEAESFMSMETSQRADNECVVRSSGIPVTAQSTNSAVWGRVCMKNRLDVKDIAYLTASTSDYYGNDNKEDQDALTNLQGTSCQEKQMIPEDAGARVMDSTAKTQNDIIRSMRKSSKKALRTIFVCGVPHQSNRRDALLSHFQKFGEVIDIYIPPNSERAFVQFSKREEAEAALRAPDAVMGNRFIKLWWANRDSIPDDGIKNSSNLSVTPLEVPISSIPAQTPMVNKGKDNFPVSVSKVTTVPPPEASLSSSGHPKPGIINGPKASPPLQKKLELEQLKEELRKKRELLAQKRDDFRRKLDKLEKQATGVKGELLSEPAAKRLRVGIASDAAKATNLFNPAVGEPSPHAETMTPKNNKAGENVILSSPKTKTLLQQLESTSSKQQIRPMVAAGVPLLMNRYNLDNQPTAFRIAPPLPLGLANVDALKEHFSSYGDLSTVVLEGTETTDDSDWQEVPKNCAASVTFTTRHSAEWAFSNGKCWQGNNLQFTWVSSSSSVSDPSGREHIPSASKGPIDTNIQPAGSSGRENSPSASRGPIDTNIQPARLMESHEVSASENEEPDISERNSDTEHMELLKISESTPTSVPVEGKSPKYEASATIMSGMEESLKPELSPTATYEEKELPRDDAC